ncbi:UvrD-helicase domain-containing protein [Pseudoduganella sp. SL102]|uniref:UvrD-helicase domain-containing protein n=1 Tax=Pseudoduganella sp. SL102 TaxID=2995154 RepID=UPI00248B441A|nr:UvrD-helicase domain-containing protein [Pseudoduganella sp. SL102]WBS04101.1 UvrD-helicase domain-containing protein [Pseudoduganella sp. SL102]
MHNARFTPALEEDARARHRALDPESFIVQAPAGSGKTELLTQRFLALLARVDHPEEVVALTFTNKAAGEMRSRIVASLGMAATRPRPGDELPHRQTTYDLASAVLECDRVRGWDLVEHPGRLNILTIDALCGNLVRQMPYLSRFGHQPQVEPDATRYYRIAAEETLAMVEGTDADAQCVRSALRYFHNDTFTLGSMLASMLAQRDQWHCHGANGQDVRTGAQQGLDVLVASILREGADILDAPVQKRIMPAARFAASTNNELAALLDWNEVLTGQASELAAWQALASLLLTSDGKVRRTLRRPDGFPAGDPQAKAMRDDLLHLLGELPVEAATCLHGLRSLPQPSAIQDSWEMVDIMDRLLTVAEARLTLVFRQVGAVDFVAIAQHALGALGTEDAPTDLTLALEHRISHLLIDEFQDTSPGQVALAAALTRGWRPGDGRTLFVVGDPMQSIYRFRKAEVGLFLDVARKGIGDIRLEHLRLHRNNRSDPVIVDWINAVFPFVFPQQADARAGAVSYASCSTDRPACGHAKVSVHSVHAGQDEEALGSDETNRIIGIIEATRAAHPLASIAVLVRARRHLNDLVGTIRQLRPDLLYQAVEIESLSGRQVVQDLLSLTHAVSHRADRVHWLAILRAPWCGLTLHDLHCLAGDDHDSTIWQLMHDDRRFTTLSQDGQRRLLHLRLVLEEAFAHQGRQLHARWIEQIWRHLGGPVCLSTDADLQDANAYFTLLGQCTRSGNIDLELLVERVEKLYSSPNPDAAARRVQLMTIHRSKGLEFDCVIVPGLGQSPRPPDRRLMLWERLDLPTAGTCIIPAVVPPKASEDTEGDPGAGDKGDLVYKLLQRMEAKREYFEAQRLLYVAVTRARQKLYLLGALKEKGGEFEPAKGSLLSLLWHSPAKEAFVRAALASVPNNIEVPQIGQQDEFVAPLVRLHSPVIAGHSKHRNHCTPNPRAGAVVKLDRDKSDISLDAATGTLVHRYLEMIANDGLALWPVARCAALQPACEAWLHSQGFSHQYAIEGAQRALLALCAVLESDIGKWILSEHQEAHAEKPLTSRLQDDGGQVNHIVDRTFVFQGERWIIDYKTVCCNDAHPRDFLERHAEENYRGQLERYAALFSDEGLKVRAAILYVMQGELVELMPKHNVSKQLI